MTQTRRIAHLVCGRRTKWVVVALWIAMFALMGPLSSKLNSIQVNNAESYLPGAAESTQVIAQLRTFRAEDALPAVVVYVRDTGITEADLAKADGGPAGVHRLTRPRHRR